MNPVHVPLGLNLQQWKIYEFFFLAKVHESDLTKIYEFSFLDRWTVQTDVLLGPGQKNFKIGLFSGAAWFQRLLYFYIFQKKNLQKYIFGFRFYSSIPLPPGRGAVGTSI